MAQIIVVIGKRKSGKTTACDYLRAFDPSFFVVHMNAYLLAAFSKLHQTSAEELTKPIDREINRDLMYLYSEFRRKKDKNVFLNPIMDGISKLDNNCLVDNVMYFNELEALIKLYAEVIYIDTETPKRHERGATLDMDQNPSELEVADISPSIVKQWGGFVVDNNKDAMHLKTAISIVIHDIWRKDIKKK